jgi:hypothetical protein
LQHLAADKQRARIEERDAAIYFGMEPQKEELFFYKAPVLLVGR